MQNIKPIPLENLLVDLQNPRYEPRSSQREALKTYAHSQAQKLFNLAEDIISNGFDPSGLVMVMPDENGRFVVLEGNRRIAALKILADPSLLDSLELPQRLAKKYKSLYSNSGLSIPKEVFCSVVPSREDAKEWIKLKHTGENEGVGVVGWDGPASHRFRGMSPALQAMDMSQAGRFLSPEVEAKLPQLHITNIERILGTPEARKLLGVDVRNSKLILISPEEEALGRLSLIISDIALGRKKVSDLDIKQQRIDYAQEIASRTVPKPHKQTPGGIPTKSAPALPATPFPARRINLERKTLIPTRLRMDIPRPRINQIYHELQTINAEKFPNSCAVLLRVFIEMSIAEFAENNKISLRKITKGSRPVDLTLRQKILSIADYLEQNKLCVKDDLLGIRILAKNRDHVLSIDTLHAYVHNTKYTPSPSELRTKRPSGGFKPLT